MPSWSCGCSCCVSNLCLPSCCVGSSRRRRSGAESRRPRYSKRKCLKLLSRSDIGTPCTLSHRLSVGNIPGMRRMEGRVYPLGDRPKVVCYIVLKAHREDQRNEASPDRRGDGCCACVLRAGVGATSKSIRRKLDGYAWTKPRRAGSDPLQHRHSSSFTHADRPRIWSEGIRRELYPVGCASDALRHQLCNAAEAPPRARLAWQDGGAPRHAARWRPAIDWEHCQSAKPGRAAAAAGGQFLKPCGPP